MSPIESSLHKNLDKEELQDREEGGSDSPIVLKVKDTKPNIKGHIKEKSRKSGDMTSPFPDLKLFFVNILLTVIITIILTIIFTLILP